MRVKLSWLNELVNISDLKVEELKKIISLYSTEVESVEQVATGSNLLVGHVLQCEPHPDSDHLHLCLVDIGTEKLSIVCGAPNVSKGQKVVVATIGCVLPGGLVIKKAKIRGVESSGMICSLAELGVEKKYIPEEYQAGIYYFKHDVKVGSSALAALDFDDVVFDLAITPNRGDLMSMLGVAIEVAAVLNRPLKPLAYQVENEEKDVKLTVAIESNACHAYLAQAFKNVQIKPSPWWLIARLIAFGIRPINNVVDITNYILALFGQPLHAFDYQKLGSKIVVRQAREGEVFTTLDGVKRDLLASDLVITDGEKPVALAGVMGGKETEIVDGTTDIVLEVAVFDPMTIRKTSQRLALRSESSARFERGVDVNRSQEALAYASYLLKNLAKAKPSSEIAMAGLTNKGTTLIAISENDVSQLLGIKVPLEEMRNLFERLQFKVEKGQDLLVKVPNRRHDIKIKNDLIEEIGRLHGYTNLPNTLPKSAQAGALTPKQRRRRIIKQSLAALGLSEAITYSLVNEQYNEAFADNHHPNSQAISLINPLSSDRGTLRKGILLSLIEVVKYNYARKMKDIALFEIGKGYSLNAVNQEEELLAIVMANRYFGNIWQKDVKVDFYVIKGVLENLAKNLNINLTFKPMMESGQELHPRRSADVYLDNEKIGFIGSLHPQFALASGLDEVYVGELKLEKILQTSTSIKHYEPMSKYPHMERDLALVLPKEVLAGDIIESIKKTASLISDVYVFDVYTGENVEKDQKSLAVRIIFTSHEPLSEEIISPKMNKIVKTLANEFKAQLRS
ncbi:MAG TPA: phenylalanine--tRNA ligase subunit beta [Bacilli bacterium]|nr:phenylalanine--tRNA ligase subunit beta [Bacilli bacterium]